MQQDMISLYITLTAKKKKHHQKQQKTSNSSINILSLKAKGCARLADQHHSSQQQYRTGKKYILQGVNMVKHEFDACDSLRKERAKALGMGAEC